MKRLVISILLLIFPFLLLQGLAQNNPSVEKVGKRLVTADYPTVFGEHWTGAITYAEEQRLVWDSLFAVYGVDRQLAEAVVFPELVRYSKFRDSIEKATMRRLYAHGGSELGNFSIGVFQMKATFAERIETLWMQTDWSTQYGLSFDLADNKFYRQKRLERLCSTEWQCVYLALFLKIVPRLYPQMKTLSEDDRVRFLATAYNYSFSAPFDKIMGETAIPRFHVDIVEREKTTYYSYADIALAHWHDINKGE